MASLETHAHRQSLSQLRLRAVAHDVLDSLYQHRLLTTNQLRALHAPQSSRRWMQRVLAELEHDGLIEPLQRGGALRVWFLTEAGAKLAEARPDREERRRPKVFQSPYYADFHAAHTLRVNDVGIAFLEAARARGDTFTPRSWRHEIAHPIGPPPGMRRGELVITDAVFSYLHRADSGASIHYRFVELDRGTLPVDRLIAKLARYTRLYRFRPKPARGKQADEAWRAHYPVFPVLMVVFADQPRRSLESRMQAVELLYPQDHQLSRTPQVAIQLCLLEDLQRKGPFAPVFSDLNRGSQSVNWIGEPASRPVRADGGGR